MKKNEKNSKTQTKDIYRGVFDLMMDAINRKCTWEQAAQRASALYGYNHSADFMRQSARALQWLHQNGRSVLLDGKAPEVPTEETTCCEKTPVNGTINADGSASREYVVSSDRLEKLFQGGDLSERKVREFFGIPDDLVITGMKYQIWHGATAGGGKQMLYNIKVNLAPKTAQDLTPEDFEQFFDENENRFAALPAVAKFAPTSKAATYLECDFADPHFGLFASEDEVGEPYNLKIARERALMCAHSIVYRYEGKQFLGINFVSMGDIINVNSCAMTTAHGTPQDTDGSIAQMLDVTVGTLVEIIRILEKLESPITFTYVPGNHDTNLGYAVAKCVQAMLKDDPNVTFDITPSIFKTVTYGCTIVGLSHGEANDKRAHTDLINRYRREFGQADYAEVHMGHLHSEAAKDVVGGIMVYRVPAICPSSYWEKSKGYAAVNRGVMTFEYDPYEGPIGIGKHTITGINARLAAEKKGKC